MDAGRRRGTLLAVATLLAVPFSLLMAAAVGLMLLVGLPGTGGFGNQGCGLQPSGSSALTSPMTPGSYRLTSGFGSRSNPVTGKAEGHRGQDFGAPAGTPIFAAASGVVVAAGPAGGFGQWIVIDHRIDGKLVSTVYGHMWPRDLGVSRGNQVQAGQPIARVGSNGQSTGPHLHFEVWEGGRFADGEPVDPMPLLAEPGSGAPPAPVPRPAAAVQVLSTTAAPTAAQLMPLRPTGRQRSMPLTAEQLRNAGTIVGVGKGTGMPPRAWVVAIATALQESTLINLDYGDRDSLGLFQQRPSQGWGTRAQIMDPRYSSARFYEAFNAKVVQRIPDWQTRSLTQLAQIVQRSGFPEAYAKWETVSVNAVLAVHGVAPIDGGVPVAC
ncbi:MAG: M23 family metallopeptidase [Pseudonocardiaceae bacterium]